MFSLEGNNEPNRADVHGPSCTQCEHRLQYIQTFNNIIIYGVKTFQVGQVGVYVCVWGGGGVETYDGSKNQIYNGKLPHGEPSSLNLTGTCTGWMKIINIKTG